MALKNKPTGDDPDSPNEQGSADLSDSPRKEVALKEDAAFKERVAQKYRDEIAGLSDSQYLNIYRSGHMSGGTMKSRTTVGEFRKKLQEGVADAKSKFIFIDFENGKRLILGDNDYYELEVVTPEKKEADDKEEEALRQIEDLKKLGVDPAVFCIEEYGEAPKFYPEQILEFGKIIEKYLQDKKG